MEKSSRSRSAGARRSRRAHSRPSSAWASPAALPASRESWGRTSPGVPWSWARRHSRSAWAGSAPAWAQRARRAAVFFRPSSSSAPGRAGGDHPRVAQLQQIAAVEQGQTLCRQLQHLGHVQKIQAADALQPRLGNLPVAGGGGGGAVDVLLVVDLLGGPAAGGAADDGEGHVRLEGHEAAVGVGEGQDMLADQKALVAGVQVVGLKAAHAVGQIAPAAVQRPQAQPGPLLRAQGLQIQHRHVLSLYCFAAACSSRSSTVP